MIMFSKYQGEIPNHSNDFAKKIIKDNIKNNPQKLGFTLAEVLITLGIIGVVAALTMPTLITNVQNKIFYTRFMKARNMIENAYQMFESEYDKPFEPYSINPSYREEAEEFTSYFKGAIFINENNVEKECIEGYDKKNIARNYDGSDRDGNDSSKYCTYAVPYGAKTMDGMLIMYNQDQGVGNSGFVDTNGSNKGPNILGKDIFIFNLGDEKDTELCGNMWGPKKDCEYYNNQCTESNKDGEYCGQRLIEEGKINY